MSKTFYINFLFGMVAVFLILTVIVANEDNVARMIARSQHSTGISSIQGWQVAETEDEYATPEEEAEQAEASDEVVHNEYATSLVRKGVKSTVAVMSETFLSVLVGSTTGGEAFSGGGGTESDVSGAVASSASTAGSYVTADDMPATVGDPARATQLYKSCLREVEKIEKAAKEMHPWKRCPKPVYNGKQVSIFPNPCLSGGAEVGLTGSSSDIPNQNLVYGQCCTVEHHGCCYGVGGSPCPGGCCGSYVWHVFDDAINKYGLRVLWPHTRTSGSYTYTWDPGNVKSEYKYLILNQWNDPNMDFDKGNFIVGNLMPGDVMLYKFPGVDSFTLENKNPKGRCTESSECLDCYRLCKQQHYTPYYESCRVVADQVQDACMSDGQHDACIDVCETKLDKCDGLEEKYKKKCLKKAKRDQAKCVKACDRKLSRCERKGKNRFDSCMKEPKKEYKKCVGRCSYRKKGPCYGGSSHINIVGLPRNSHGSASYNRMGFERPHTDPSKGVPFPKWLKDTYYCKNHGPISRGETLQRIYRFIPECIEAAEYMGKNVNFKTIHKGKIISGSGQVVS